MQRIDEQPIDGAFVIRPQQHSLRTEFDSLTPQRRIIVSSKDQDMWSAHRTDFERIHQRLAVEDDNGRLAVGDAGLRHRAVGENPDISGGREAQHSLFKIRILCDEADRCGADRVMMWHVNCHRSTLRVGSTMSRP